MVGSRKRKLERPWFERNPSAFDGLRQEITSQFPNLHLLIENRQAVIRGSLAITHNGTELDRYAIEVRLSDEHPFGPALVYDTQERIPRKADEWHVNPNGSLCVGVPEELWPSRQRPLNLVEFINGPVRSFLLRNSIIERGASWPHGEWAHGAEGIYQYYESRIGESDRAVIRRFMEYLSKPVPKGHWDCPCGNGERIRNCHGDLIRALHAELPIEAVRYSLNLIQRELAVQAIRQSAAPTRPGPQ